jgi:hypothetical protein
MDYKEKQQKIIELGKMIALSGKLPYTKRSKIGELQDRLRFRLRELEEQGMDEKIKAMEGVLEIIHSK